ncbi:MAG: T9SS type A sorting domain-containing protein [Bacteroidales bacterium]|nr:T9SS type A sorting domain-containing protein [Bacteroidales bacterium]
MKTNKIYILLSALFLIIFLNSTALHAQDNWQISWQQCYGSEWDEEAVAITETPQGYLVLANIKNFDPNFDFFWDAVVYHIDKKGNLLWKRIYGGSNGEYPGDILSDKQGYYYLSIETFSNDGDVQSVYHGGGDRWIVKIDIEGNIIWERCYGGSGEEYGARLKLLSDGNILAYSATTSGDGDVPVNYGYLDNWLLIFNPEGEILQSRVFGNIGQNNIFDITETRDGGFFFATKASEVEGMVEGDYHGGQSDVWAVKLDTKLEIEWQKLYGGSGLDYGTQGVIELDNGYIFLASTDSPNDGDVWGYHYGDKPDIWVVRIDSIGNILWQKCLGGSSWDYPMAGIYQMQDSSFMVVAETWSSDGDVQGYHHGGSSGNSAYDIWMSRLSANGELLWSRCFGGAGWEWPANNVLQLADDNWLIAAGASKYKLSDSLLSGDMACVSEEYGRQIWLFNFKDCANYMPATPQPPTGPDTLCHTVDSTSVYQIAGDSTAWDYNWLLEPTEAGTITADSLQAMVKWNSSYQGPAHISAAAWNDCGESAWSTAKTTMVYSCVGMPEQKETGLAVAVYPNPAKDYIIFEMQANKSSVSTSMEIFDIYGRIVASLPMVSGKAVLDVKSFSNGIYFYQLSHEGRHQAGKFVVQ